MLFGYGKKIEYSFLIPNSSCFTFELVMASIIFTGLDGTLLPSENVDYEPVLAAIEQLQQHNIPLIPVTNNTRAEVEELRRKIGWNTPFVVERGSGIFIPQGNTDFNLAETEIKDNYHFYQLGCTYTEARAALKAVQEEISKILRGFGDLDEENIQTIKGISPAAARRAKSREFSEYFLTPNRLDITQLQTVAEEYGFKIIPEGKLSLVMGGNADSRKAITWLKKNYQLNSSDKITTVGIGSTQQDLSLLESVDIPIVVPTAEGVEPSFAERNWEVVADTGRQGWINAIAKIIQH